MTDLPGCLEDVSRDWVRDALGNTFGSPVAEVAVTNLGDGIGQVSELGRLDLTLESGAVRSVVVKTRTNVEGMHRIGIDYRMYEREVNFYNELAPRMPMRTPEVYFARWEEAAGRVAIIMELMEGWYSPDQIRGASRSEVESALTTLAPLTAGWWNSPERADIDWLGDAQAAYYRQSFEDYAGVTDEFLTRFGDRIPESGAVILDAIVDSRHALLHAYASGPYALAHWDYRVENLFFNEQTGEVAALDWQLMMWQNPAWDFSYLITTNLPVEARRDWQDELAEFYVGELERHGVTNYDTEQLFQDMRICLPGITGVPVVGGSGADMTNARSKELFSVIAERVFTAMEDVDSLSAITGLP